MSSFEGTSRRNFRAETVSWLSQASEGAEIEGFIVSTAEKGALLSLNWTQVVKLVKRTFGTS